MTDSAAENSPRSSGILLHPTSLPGPYGIGDLGAPAYQWIDALAQAGQKWWQLLPLNPTGYGDSPYSSFSAFAGNPYLISPDLLLEDGLIQESNLSGGSFNPDRVEYGRVVEFKLALLHIAWNKFQADRQSPLRVDFAEFNSLQHRWLDDYALFRSIKENQGGKPWYDWPMELIKRKPDALHKVHNQLQQQIGFHKFCQFLFHRQWQGVRDYAHERDIKIIGDAPIFVADDSTDVWANPHLFQLDEKRQPRVVAGVPPDYFSATGQLWGNPLYDWKALEQSDFEWWVDRVRTTLEQVDMVRLDHFRGFEAYWEVPAGMPTAEQGKWVKAPGAKLFTTLRNELGRLPLIAEDLGLITEEVHELREQFELPGMRVLQFAFGGGSDNPYLMHNYEQNTVVYTGTHDNNTTRGWYEQAPEHEKDHLRRYLARDGSDVAWDLIRAAWASTADYAIAPLQDVLDLGSEARMNFPGQPDGNWGWRYREEMLQPDILDRLADLTELYGR